MTVYKLLQTLLLVVVQGLVLNHVDVMGYATPMPYIYVLLTFPQNTGRKALLLWGFLTGVMCDMFTNTPGISAAACTLMGMMQPRLLWYLSPRDSSDDFQPSLTTMGVGGFTRYLFVSTLVFQTAYYLLLVFSLSHPADIAYNIGGGTLFTLLLMLCIASFHKKKKV
ncbi:MAG: rod shape-determining protein MreD [Bacteroidaceae bacterium]|nr:rod shape-determining protein MreD [Bacteroidaceae bacterium]